MEKETLLAPGCTVEMLERFYSPRNADVRKGTIKKVDVSHGASFCYYIVFESGTKGWYSKWDITNCYDVAEGKTAR